MAMPKGWTHIAIPVATKDLLKDLSGDGTFPIWKVIEYLLVRSDHLAKEDGQIDYEAMNRFINGQE